MRILKPHLGGKIYKIIICFEVSKGQDVSFGKQQPLNLNHILTKGNVTLSQKLSKLLV